MEFGGAATSHSACQAAPGLSQLSRDGDLDQSRTCNNLRYVVSPARWHGCHQHRLPVVRVRRDSHACVSAADRRRRLRGGDARRFVPTAAGCAGSAATAHCVSAAPERAPDVGRADLERSRTRTNGMSVTGLWVAEFGSVPRHRATCVSAAPRATPLLCSNGVPGWRRPVEPVSSPPSE